MPNYRLEDDRHQITDCDQYTDFENRETKQGDDYREKARQQEDRTIIDGVIKRGDIEDPVSECGCLQGVVTSTKESGPQKSKAPSRYDWTCFLAN